MALTRSPNRVEIKQLTDNRKKYAMAIFDGKVNDVFSFIEKFAKPQRINNKNILENPLNIEIEIDSFSETLIFLQEENCIEISKNPNKKIIEYFKRSVDTQKYDLFKEHKDLLFMNISLNKRNFKKLIKQDFCTKQHFFEINKDRINVRRWKIGLILGILVSFIIFILAQVLK